jgi:hypothetical protein
MPTLTKCPRCGYRPPKLSKVSPRKIVPRKKKLTNGKWGWYVRVPDDLWKPGQTRQLQFGTDLPAAKQFAGELEKVRARKRKEIYDK